MPASSLSTIATGAIAAVMAVVLGAAMPAAAQSPQGPLSVQSVVAALGPLSGSARYDRLQTLRDAGRLKGPYTPADVDAFVAGMEPLRLQTLQLLSLQIKPGLVREEIVQLLRGLTNQPRYDGLRTLRDAGRFTGPFTPADVDALLAGMEPLRLQTLQLLSGQIMNSNSPPAPTTLPSAYAEIKNQANQSAAQNGAASVSQPASVASAPAATAVTVASIDARIARLRNIESTQLPYLYESTGVLSDISIVARDLPVRLAGFTDYRALYDQLYFASIQYAGLANRWIRKGQAAKANGDFGTATRCLDHATQLLQQRQSSYDAALAAADKDLARATIYVRATYQASKWAAKIVAGALGVPGASTMVDAAGGFIDFALNVQESGFKSATSDAFVDALTYAIITKMPIPDLGGRTLEKALQNQTGKILASSGVIAAVHNGLNDAGVRKVVVDGAKSLLALPIQSRVEDQINAALDRLFAVDPAAF